MNVKLIPYFGYFSLTPLSQTRTKLYILTPYKDIKLLSPLKEISSVLIYMYILSLASLLLQYY